jgi:type I restriction enzyme S subunit
MTIGMQRLGDIAEVVMGLSPKGSTYNNEGIGLPLLNGPTEFGPYHPNCSLFTTDSKRICEQGDLIFCVRGSTTGRMNWADKPYSLGRGVCAIRGNTNIDTKFIRYCLECYLESLLKIAGGGTFPSLRQDDITSFVIQYPTHRDSIVAILSPHDDLIENNSRRIQLLEEMARALYREWFVHFRFPGHENVEMVDSGLGTIPEGWEVRHLSEMVSTQYGYTESTQEKEVGPKYVRGMDINKTSYITWDSVPYCRIDTIASERYKLNERDILVIRMADPGKVAIIEKDIEAVFASYLIRLKIKDGSMLQYFLFYTLSAEHYQDFISAASTGTTRKSASAPLITNYNVVVPTRDVMDKFEVSVQSLRRLLNNLLDQNAVLRRSRDLLLPKLISGQIDVSNMEIEVYTDNHQTPKYSDLSALDQWLDGDEDHDPS